MGLPTFTWPDYRKAPEGTRFEHVRTGRRGTFIRPARNRHNSAIVVWDDRPFPTRDVCEVPGSVFFVGIAHEARPVTKFAVHYDAPSVRAFKSSRIVEAASADDAMDRIRSEGHKVIRALPLPTKRG